MPEDIIQLKKDLSEHELSLLNSELEKHKKSAALTYALWFFLGWLGAHKFYIGKIKMGILYLILVTFAGIGSWFLIPTLFYLAEPSAQEISSKEAGVVGMGILGAICGIVLVILLLIDVFTIPRQIRKTYEQAERRILSKIKSGP